MSTPFQKKRSLVQLDDNDPDLVDVDMLTVGVKDVTAFAGVNGPYWTDSDGDGVITPNAEDNGDGIIEVHESDELSEDALGLEPEPLAPLKERIEHILDEWWNHTTCPDRIRAELEKEEK